MEIQIEKKFNNFYEIVDDYLENIFLTSQPNSNSNSNNINKKIGYDCELGSIEFVQYINKSIVKKIIVHEIYIGEQYRNQGLCREFIKYLIDKLENKNILIIQSVLSKILYNFLLRFKYIGKKFILKKEGFVYVK